jgi:hypothetical protein
VYGNRVSKNPKIGPEIKEESSIEGLSGDETNDPANDELPVRVSRGRVSWQTACGPPSGAGVCPVLRRIDVERESLMIANLFIWFATGWLGGGEQSAALEQFLSSRPCGLAC